MGMIPLMAKKRCGKNPESHAKSGNRMVWASWASWTNSNPNVRAGEARAQEAGLNVKREFPPIKAWAL
jgi:hypothetical protein